MGHDPHPSIAKYLKKLGGKGVMPWKAGANNPNWRGGLYVLPCENCGGEFGVPRGRSEKARFCSLTCANDFMGRTPHPGRGVPKKEPMTKTCPMCLKPFSGPPAATSRQRFCGARCAGAWRSRHGGTFTYSRSKKGWRDGLGKHYFRSSWEANYARYLNLLVEQKQIAAWDYEAKTFWFENIRRGVRSYTPDFQITRPDGSTYFVEVKGWMDKKSATKIKRMAKYHPNVQLVIVGRQEYTAIQNGVGRGIPGWEK